MTRAALCLVLLTSSGSLACLPGAAAIDAQVRAAMTETRANGMAIAVIDDGRVAYGQTSRRGWGSLFSKGHRAADSSKAATTGRRPTASSASSAIGGASCFSPTMFGPRHVSLISCALCWAKPASPMIGNMAIRRASRDCCCRHLPATAHDSA